MGEWICDELTHRVAEIEAEQRVREPLQWLPTDGVTFDIQCLHDAEIILLDGSDPTALIRRIVEFHRPGERLRGVARGGTPVIIGNHWELTVDEDIRIELVLSPTALDVIQTYPRTAQQFSELLNEDNARYLVYEDITISVGIGNGSAVC